jgi:hypothetical protein
MVVYRPVGHKELELICDSGLREFPPRLPDQPIFYPVLNAGYAKEIAQGWNTKSDTRAGYITRFNVDNDYSQRFLKQTVGSKKHEEWWVPAEELSELNANIVGHIDVIAAYFGDGFVGSPPAKAFKDKGASADKFLQMLLETFEYNGMDFTSAIVMNHKSVYCNYAYWKQFDLTCLKAQEEDRLEMLVYAIADCWHRNFPGLRLPTEADIADHEQEQLEK